jgi:flagellar biosynthesis GTPase FlhF
MHHLSLLSLSVWVLVMGDAIAFQAMFRSSSYLRNTLEPLPNWKIVEYYNRPSLYFSPKKGDTRVSILASSQTISHTKEDSDDTLQVESSNQEPSSKRMVQKAQRRAKQACREAKQARKAAQAAHKIAEHAKQREIELLSPAFRRAVFFASLVILTSRYIAIRFIYRGII